MASASYGHGRGMQGERRTALIALAKLVGGVTVGSAAMLAEGAHSIADTANQGLMLVSLRLGDREADEQHPFGYGKERFFWTFLVAVMIFFAGAIFALGEGVMRMFESRENAGAFWVSYLILGVAGIAEGVSFVRALRQTRAGAREAGMGLLVGEAARERDRSAIRHAVEGRAEVERLVDLRTMYVGPRSLLVAARVDLVDGVDGEGIERMAEEVDAELRRAVPDVSDVYLDP